ncbi:MAG: DNA polymerase III subunit alpha [Vicinamibacterales bacterium]
MYIELRTASAFSFLRGASLPETLVDRAAALGYPAVALLDRDGVYGAPRFHKAATAAGLKPLIGAELTITQADANPTITTSPNPQRHSPDPPDHQIHPHITRSRDQITRSRDHQITRWHLPVLVASRTGWSNLCRLVTLMKLRSPKGEGAITLDELEAHGTGLVALAGRPLLHADRFGVGGLLDRLVGIFGRDRVRVEIQRHLRRDEEADTAQLVGLAEAFRVPLVATGGVRFAAPEDRPLFDVLTSIREHLPLRAAGRRLAANAERYLKPPAQMARLFADHPAAVHATRELADQLDFTMRDLGYRFPRYPVPPGETEISFLRKIVDVGARTRYRPFHDKARTQVARELDLIEKLDLAGYFLIVWDVVNFCRQEDILVQGRGSAANSAVCYSLGITAVDPVEMELLFERFLSEERGEWPDIDLDLPSGDRRERVIQHVYRKYGQHGAAMTANVITYRGRSAAREVGKALDLDPAEVDRLAKVMHQFEYVDPDDTLSRNLASVGMDRDDPRIRLFGRLWKEMQDLPRHLGQHSGGMVICQGALSSVVPLENASMPGRVVVQWDKEDCADMGIVKVDLLGLGMMAVLQDAIRIVNADGPRIDLAHLPPDDPDVYGMLQAADTVGVFQVESRAQMATLPRLKPTCFYDLVVEVALIRPGPIVGQMVHPYLNRRSGQEAVSYAHPALEPILRRTLGVPLFQEQLLRMAMAVAGFTGGQAEALRRAMGFKRSEKRMREIEGDLRAGMARQGITGAAADQIVLSITSFALYGFPESHAASFALIAYASAYLKMHFPAAFYTALLNNQPMGFYHPATLVKDAQRRGVRFEPIDVQASDWDCTIEPDGAIRLGLRFASGLREEAGRAIEAAVKKAEGGRQKAARDVRCPKCGCDDPSMLEEIPRNEHPQMARRDNPRIPRTEDPRIPRITRNGRGDLFGDGESAIDQAALDKPSSVKSVKSVDPRSVESVESVDPPSVESASRYFCNVCAHQWTAPCRRVRFASLEDLVARAGLRRDEVTRLAEIGALNAFGHDRRAALWQAERIARPAGELFEERQTSSHEGHEAHEEGMARLGRRGEVGADPLFPDDEAAVLPAMSDTERLVADYAGTGLTIGPHPMSFRRHELSTRGVLRATDLPRIRGGRRVRTAGMVITRQRPGTAKGFVFLTLEDETGIANIIVRPDLYAKERLAIVEAPFLLVEGILQNQEGVVSVKAERVARLGGLPDDASVESHDFH